MVALTPLRGTQLYIKIENDASPAVFAHPCLINTKRGIKFTTSSNKIIVPDCDNPDDPAWTQAIKDTLGASIDGAGKLDNKAAVLSFYDAWFRSKYPKRVQVWLGTMGYWAGDFDLTNFEVTGDRGDNAEVSISLESNGAVDVFVVA